MRALRSLLSASVVVSSVVAADDSSSPGASGRSAVHAEPTAVATMEEIWRDPARDRAVPVKIYYPRTAAAKPEGTTWPVIVFSHGLGGTREAYSYLGEHWARSGYVSVHVQHHGSDAQAVHGQRPLENVGRAARDPVAARNRPLDIRFAIDRLTALNDTPDFPLHGRLDLARLGVAGHSYGALTTMAVVGARVPRRGAERPFLDPRIKAAVAMSTPRLPQGDTDAAFDDIRVPVFHMTGTEDVLSGEGFPADAGALIDHTKVDDRRRPFDHTRQAVAYLLTFSGGDHMVFSNRRSPPAPHDREFQALVCSGSTTFFDAWLKGDSRSKEWLEHGGFAKVLGALGAFEQKQAR